MRRPDARPVAMPVSDQELRAAVIWLLKNVAYHDGPMDLSRTLKVHDDGCFCEPCKIYRAVVAESDNGGTMTLSETEHR